MFPKGLHPLEQEANQKVIGIAKDTGARIYLVGGFLRDALGGVTREPRDFDYCVCGTSAIGLARKVAEQLGGHFVLLDLENDTARVVFQDSINLDFAGCVGKDIEADIKRRDFTINALAWDHNDPDNVIDLVSGIADLKSHSIRAISEQNFLDDPLRLLRAFRFASRLGGTIEPDTLAIIKRHAETLTKVAPERISYEFFLTLEADNAFPIVKAMGESGILEAIFPELSQTREVTTNAYHHLGLWDHTLELVAQAEARVATCPEWARESFREEISSGISRLAATKAACLLHDIGKPRTWNITDEGRHTFYGHDKVGADMSEKIAERMRWSRPLSRFIVKLVEWHLRPGQLFHQGPPTQKAVHRFYRNCGDDLPELMLLSFADLGATRGPGIEGENWNSLENNLIELFHGFSVFKEGQISLQRFMDGNEVMKLLAIEPGQIVGEILTSLEEAQGLGEVTTRAQAESYIRDLYKKLGPQK